MKHLDFAIVSALLLLSLTVSGCADCPTTVNAETNEVVNGRQFLLAREPSGVLGVRDLPAMLPSDRRFAILGRIGGLENPWTEGEASFVIRDASLTPLAEDDHECGVNCPYCAQQEQEQLQSMAFVQFVDRDGRVVRTSARELLGVAEDQLIVVHGKASRNRTGHIVVAATGLFIRP